MNLLTKEFIYQKSSQEITALLYEALITQIQGAMKDIENKRHFDSNKKLQKANDILERLGAGINYEAGIISDQLDALYNYMSASILKANITKNTRVLKEVITITEELAESWRTSMAKPQQPVRRMSQKVNAYEKNVMVYDKEFNKVEAGK
ncbi:flagellar export chaperone FliS [Bacillus sp. SG-1]|uniref:flagellar export chaperone FliS n=1 Tax=Bacillus sp. SG-1 TaxID=161544 RepID=UPI0002DDE5A6|nr:flagellar export chaperone FliS [Bacillus sp. SG-1]